MIEAEQPRPINYGIKPDNLPQVIEKVAELYEEVSGRPLRDFDRKQLGSDRILERIIRDRMAWYRFGSTLTSHSKLWIQEATGLLRFRFNANMSNDSPTYINDGQLREEKFKAEVNKYLLELGLAEPLPDYYR